VTHPATIFDHPNLCSPGKCKARMHIVDSSTRFSVFRFAFSTPCQREWRWRQAH